MRNTKPISLTRVSVIQPKPVEAEPQCWLDECTAKGEHPIVANAFLCTVHFLRDRVRQNLAASV